MTGPSDRRKDAIVVDFRHAASVQSAQVADVQLDWLGGSNGLGITEELRQVQPGLYLGKARSGRAFLHYFAMFSEQGSVGEPTDSCSF